MGFKLYLVSKLSSDIIHVAPMGIKTTGYQDTEKIYDEIYHLSKSLENTDYQLYWRYSMDKYFPISDYISYSSAIYSSGEKKIYMLMNDYGEIWEDNISFLEDLDAQELAEKRERERDIYDVRIPGTTESPDSATESLAASEALPREPRTDLDILTYSLRNMAKPKYFQNDLRFKSNLIDDLKLGYPPRKQKIVPVEEEIIFRVIVSKSKDKKVGSKKSSKSKSSAKKKSSKGKKSRK